MAVILKEGRACPIVYTSFPRDKVKDLFLNPGSPTLRYHKWVYLKVARGGLQK